MDSNFKSWTAAHYACEQGNLEMLKFLSKYPNFNVNIGDYLGRIPLIYAIKKNHMEMVKFLVEHCAADIEFRRSDKCSALFYAIAKERTEAALYLLEKGADINAG